MAGKKETLCNFKIEDLYQIIGETQKNYKVMRRISRPIARTKKRKTSILEDISSVQLTEEMLMQ